MSRQVSGAGVVARRRRAGLIGLALGAGPLAAHGQEIAQSQEIAQAASVSGVTVVAAHNGYADVENSLSRLPRDLKEIPQSVTVLNQALLQSQGATSLADALRNVPGITLGGAEGGQIGNNINLNGFTARTDIFLDGFRDRGQYYRDTFALESIEVLMGPSSMLFGRGSTGGAINQVSKTPGPTPFAEVDLSGTTNGLARGTADVNAPLSDSAALRIAAMGQEGAVSTRRKTTVDDYGVAPSLRYGIGEPTELTLTALIQHNDDRPDYGVPPLAGAPAPVARDNVYGYADDRTIQDVRAVGAEVKRRFDNGFTLREQLQFNGVTTDARETAGQGIGTVNAHGYTPLSGTAIPPLSELVVRLQSHDRVIHDTSLYNQLELTGELATGPLRHSLLFGTEIGHDDYRNQAYSRTGSCNGVPLTTGFVGCVSLLDPAYTDSPTLSQAAGNLAKGTAGTYAAYANDTLTLTPHLKLVGGVRYDRYDARISNSINSGNTAGSTAFASLSQSVAFTSVRAGMLWQPSKAQTYYVSYSTSFDPSLEQLTSTTGLTRDLPPETNEAHEVGGKWSLLGERLELNAALFQITQDNSRSQNPDNTYTANGDIRVRGARLGFAGRLAPGWQVFGGYTHLDGTITQAIAPGTQGMVPANTPADTATLWTTYDIGSKWQVGGGGVYVSQRYLNNTDTVSVPGYARWDATLAYRFAHCRLRLNLFNLFDKRYYDNLIQSDGGRAVPGIGRTAMVTLVWRR